MALFEMHLLWIPLDFSVLHYAFQTGGRIRFSVQGLMNGYKLILWLHEIDFRRFSLMDEGAPEVYVRLDGRGCLAPMADRAFRAFLLFRGLR